MSLWVWSIDVATYILGEATLTVLQRTKMCCHYDVIFLKAISDSSWAKFG